MEHATKAGIPFIPMFDTMIVKTSHVRQMQDIFKSAMVAKSLEKVLIVR
jgi:hypothetical protein